MESGNAKARVREMILPPSSNPIDHGYSLRGTLLVPFKLISKSNHKPKGRQFLTPEQRAFENTIATLAKIEFRSPLWQRGWVVIEPVFQSKVHVDLNNIPKGVFDGLIKGGLYADDKAIACTVLPATYGNNPSRLYIYS